MSLPSWAKQAQTMAPTAERAALTLGYLGVVRRASSLVQVDRQRFLQVLYNLLSNAVKFTPPGGVVRLSCEAMPDTVVVTVSDTGIGIAPEDQARVFEEFAQVDSGLGSRSRQGTGFGLSLTRRLVEPSSGAHHLWSARRARAAPSALPCAHQCPAGASLGSAARSWWSRTIRRPKNQPAST